MKTRILTLLILLLVIILSGCKTGIDDDWVKHADPAELGFNSDSLARTDILIRRLVQEGKIPGAVAMVAKNGKVVYTASYGFQDIESGTTLDTDDIFRIASMTKPIVSAAVMKLYEDGRLKLDDPVSKFIPAFANQSVLADFNRDDTTWTTVPAEREVTIHDLLTHTSGINYGFADSRFNMIYSKNGIPDLAVSSDITIEETMQRMGSMPLTHQPGSRFTYGLGIDVLGRVIEVVSGKTLGQFVEEYITGPLRMEDTHFFFDDEYASRLTTAYQYSTQDSAIVAIVRSGYLDPNYPVSGARTYFSGGSGLSGTAGDYFIFAQAILNGGVYNGVRILKPETVALMCSDQLGELAWSDLSSFGYGFSLDRRRNTDGTAGEIIAMGWGGAFNTGFSINPADSIVTVVMSQVLFNPFGNELTGGLSRIINSSYSR